jgi:putative peptidoglycan lipid II flippase
VFALWIPHWLGLGLKWSVAALTATAGVSGWVEFLLLRRALSARIGLVSVEGAYALKLWCIAVIAATAAYSLKFAVGMSHARLIGMAVLAIYGAVYLAGTYWLGIEQSRQVLARFANRLGR